MTFTSRKCLGHLSPKGNFKLHGHCAQQALLFPSVNPVMQKAYASRVNGNQLEITRQLLYAVELIHIA